MGQKAYWENIYSIKQPHEVSWTQIKPFHSLQLIENCGLDKSARILDAGGGDSNLVDFLIEAGYENISVLDISENAIERAKKRLGEKAKNVTWIVSDVTDFTPDEPFDIWHDRAAFHFLTTPEHIEKYKTTVTHSKHLIIGTFSEEGPLKCSGLDVCRYTSEKMVETFGQQFELKEHFKDNHTTPFTTLQNFLYCRFEKR